MKITDGALRAGTSPHANAPARSDARELAREDEEPSSADADRPTIPAPPPGDDVPDSFEPVRSRPHLLVRRR